MYCRYFNSWLREISWTIHIPISDDHDEMLEMRFALAEEWEAVH